MKDFSKIDIEKFLMDFEIDHSLSGKNIGRGWIGIRPCPFCGDDRNHFAVRQADKVFSCFVCGEKTNFAYYLHLLGYKRNEQSDIIQQYSNGKAQYQIFERKSGKQVILPSVIEPIELSDNDPAYQYILSRNFDKITIEQYQLQKLPMGSFMRWTDPETGKQTRQDFQWRIFIPIMMNHRLVSFTGRDYTGEQEPKYKHPITEASIIKTGSCIYNYDTIKQGETNIAVEGPADVWRMGDRCFAMMGTKFTSKQIELLAHKRIGTLIVLFDQDAGKSADALAQNMMLVADRVIPITINQGDPGELSKIDAIRLKQELLRM
jgi:DNA primase